MPCVLFQGRNQSDDEDGGVSLKGLYLLREREREATQMLWSAFLFLDFGLRFCCCLFLLLLRIQYVILLGWDSDSVEQWEWEWEWEWEFVSSLFGSPGSVFL
ncbi:hypothetical protein EPI10_002101 [Gossypium australe]|uniref:Uncharacterized protein n=1 Tax=Gossypium australe TaxID=47621 RepID=A0A5B6VDC7_9ROSI|nr:hypothetical protein EPI10_002101 [Gossypium australe]